MKKSINLVVSIGGIDLSNKSVKNVTIDRNFSDTYNKFTMTIIDSPEVALTDLELYINGGFRNINISYADRAQSNKFVKMSGTIWDSTTTFVGDRKQLTLSGYATRRYALDNTGTALYNIDFNTYYNKRANTRSMWGALKQAQMYSEKYIKWQRNFDSWLTKNRSKYKSEEELYANIASEYKYLDSIILDKNFREYYTWNALTVPVKGPGGTIYLPIPASFTTMQLTTATGSESDARYTYGDEVDTYQRFYGRMFFQHLSGSTKISKEGVAPTLASDPSEVISHYTVDIDTGTACQRIELTDMETQNYPGVYYSRHYAGGAHEDYYREIRAFHLDNDPTFYIEMDDSKSYYGAGQFIYNNKGVDISAIVKNLCKLEGWKYTDSSIVQTELVPCSDIFKMNNQSAMAFIHDNLIPNAVTPTGATYKTTQGKWVRMSTNIGGFVAYFDSNNIFHFEPLTRAFSRSVTTEFNLGYNLPNSPVISFQVDTKGTAFYTTNNIILNSMSIATGKQMDSVTVSETLATANQHNRVFGHNDDIDEFFGFSYEEVEAYIKAKGLTWNSSTGGWIGFGTETHREYIFSNNPDLQKNTTLTESGGINDISWTGVKSTSEEQITYRNGLNYQNRLVNSSLPNSSSAKAAISNAYNKIKAFAVTASLQLWGDTAIYPSCIISITNMVKSANKNYPAVHPTTGTYMVLKQTDTISDGEFSQKLSLIRYTESVKNAMNSEIPIDWSVKAQSSTDISTSSQYIWEESDYKKQNGGAK